MSSWPGDVFSTPSKDTPNPLTGSFFLLEKIDNPAPAPYYDYDESGVVLKGKRRKAVPRGVAGSNFRFSCLPGELHIEDEKGNKAVLSPGDTFFIHRGSTIVFSTPRFAVAYKVAARHRMH